MLRLMDGDEGLFTFITSSVGGPVRFRRPASCAVRGSGRKARGKLQWSRRSVILPPPSGDARGAAGRLSFGLNGDEADEGYTVIREALKNTRKIAIGQLIMQGREHLVGVKALDRGLALYILRYADQLREPSRYFGGITAEPAVNSIAATIPTVAARRRTRWPR